MVFKPQLRVFRLFILLLTTVFATSVSAAPVINWNLDSSLNGLTSLTGVSTNSPLLGNGTANNAENSAIWATFPETVIPDGEGIRLSGEVTIAGSVPGRLKFRWGLFNEQGAGPPDPTSGWLGYSLSNSNGTGPGLVIERKPGGTGFNSTSFASLSTTHAQSIDSAFDFGSDLFENGTYQFEMTVARDGPSINLFGSLDGNNFSNSWVTSDTSPAAGLDATFNRIGLIAGSGMQADQLQFSNLDLSPVTNPPQLSCAITTSCFINEVFDNGQGVTMPYQLIPPPGHNQPGANFPLILYMHGGGGPGIISGLVGSSQTEEFPAFILAPQNSFAGGGWGPQNSQDLTLDILQEVIDNYGIDEQRIYVTGLSLGGYGTEAYVLNQPSLFAAAVPIAGSAISPEEAKQMKDVPFWVFMGELDQAQAARDSVQALEDAGGTPIYTELANQGHNIWNPIYADWQTDTHGLYPWLFSQSLAVPEPGTMILTLLGTFLVAPMARRRSMPRNGLRLSIVLTFVVLANSASAAPVINWNLDSSLNGLTSLTNASTNSPTLGDGSFDNANDSAIWTTFPEAALADGQGIRFSGNVTLTRAEAIGRQFRWGLFRETSSAAPDPTSGWLGYMSSNSNLTTPGFIYERNSAGIDFNNASFSDIDPSRSIPIVSSSESGLDPFDDDTYAFDITVVRDGGILDVSASLRGDNFFNFWSKRDTTPEASLNATFNRVGLVSGAGMQADQLQFSNLDVSVLDHPPRLSCSITKSCFADIKIADNGQGVTMPYQLLLPPGHDQPGAKFPLIIYMHGSGGGGVLDGLINASQSLEFASFVVAPQLPGGFWDPQNPQDLTLDILQEVIDNYAVDGQRIYITGISAGGFGTTRYILNDPSMFAAGVPLSGASSISPAEAELIKDVPFWLFHGASDIVVLPEESRDFVQALEDAGGSPLYTELAFQGHSSIWGPTYADWRTDTHGLYPWLFSQSLAVPEPGTLGLIFLASMPCVVFRRRKSQGQIGLP